ncbi:uncharacterized protein DUF4173 [Paenibacillus taihuensis]|uniref:Uncharacterized protein DUF4173 n=1 Tax=Paenibacillus taihuensis TaxID=1156355 RepID=A0A3D9RX60_9BACL|nr:DUF4173 domain-containing protein [Paenibacillus taihuensis]REE81275.1 uncharacterized protein DUF4173 [Paenibacillus taihuensis]
MRDPAPWQRRYERIALLSLLFGLISQYLMIGHSFGINVPLFVALFYGLYFYAVQGRIGGFDQWRGQSKSGWLLCLPIALLSLTYVLFANTLFQSLNIVVLPALAAAQTVLLTRSSAKPWYRAAFYHDVLYVAIFKPITYISVPFELFASRFLPNGFISEASSPAVSRARRIVLGLLLAAPLLLIVILLLASADSIFQSLLNRIPSLFGDVSIGNGIVRLIAAFAIALYAFCYLWTLLFRRTGEQLQTPPARLAKVRFLFDPITAETLLICFNLVYLVFAAIQFSYLFGAASGLLPEGAAYADYARQGFAQLVVVSIINLGLLLGGLHLVKREGQTAETVRKISLSLLVGCTIVMLVSAFSRLQLYEQAYGFTQTRLLVHGFMLFLGLVLLMSLIRIWREHFSLAKAYIGLAVAAYVVMNYINIDAIIAEQNSIRYSSTGKIDLEYLKTLSPDALPALVKLQKEHQNDLPALTPIIDSIRNAAIEHGSWQSWSWPQQRARDIDD